MKKLILAGIVLLMLTGIGAASPENLVRNGGFEEPRLCENTGLIECQDAVIQDWVTGGSGFNDIRTRRTLSERQQFIDLSRGGNGYVSQSIATTALNSYTLSFEMAGNPECSPYEKLLLVYWGNLPAYGPYSYSITGQGDWVTIVLDDLPGTEGTTQLKFEDVSASSSACGVALDNISVISKGSAPLPEFPTLTLPLGLMFSFSGAAFYISSTREH